MLENMQIQLGLCINGLPICGHIAFLYLKLCQYFRGVTLSFDLLDKQRLSVHWLVETFDELVDDADNKIVHCFAQAYIMHLIGGYLTPNRISHKVPLMYLSLFKNFDKVGQYSQGSVVFAHLYREMCNVIKYSNKTLMVT